MQGKQNRTAHKPDRLVDVVGRVPGEGVVQVPDEIVLVLVLEGHERAAHHDELDLVHRVAELAELVHAILRLQVRVVSARDKNDKNEVLKKDLPVLRERNCEVNFDMYKYFL